MSVPGSALPRLAAPAAKAAGLEPAALELLAPDMSPMDFVTALGEGGQNEAAVPFLANAMPPEAGTKWACDSCALAQEMGAPPLAPADQAAVDVAAQYAAAPGPETASQAAAAAAQATPGTAAAWTAQSAAWAEPAAAEAAGLAIAPDLAPKAVSGAVQLAAADAAAAQKEVVPPPEVASEEKEEEEGPWSKKKKRTEPEEEQPPKEEDAEAVAREKTNKVLQPFVDKGVEIAKGSGLS